MRTIATLVLKDLRRRLRSPLGAVILLLFPVVFALLIGLAFGVSGEQKMPPVEILLVDEDASLVGRLLGGAAGNASFAERFHLRPVPREEGERLMAEGKASALLLIPEGFTDRLLAGQADTLRLWRNPAESAMPFVAQELAEVVAVGLSGASRAFSEPLAAIRTFTQADGIPAADSVSAVAGAITRGIQDVQPYANPVLVGLQSVRPGAEPDTTAGGAAVTVSDPVGIALYILPGIAVLALLMIGQMSMRDILREDAAGTLRRIHSAPVTLGQIVASKIVGSAVLALICLLILSLVAAVLGARGVDPAGFVVLSLAFLLAVGGYGAVAYGLARSERQGSTVGEIILMFMAFLGGSWIPLQNLSAGLQRVAPFTLNYWAIDGYRRLQYDSAGLLDLARHVAILGSVGIILAYVGARGLRRRLLQGA